MSDDPILQQLGRIEGKLDGALLAQARHDGAIDTLRRDHQEDVEKAQTVHADLDRRLTTISTTLRVVWGFVAAIVIGLGTLAAIVQAAHS